MERVERGITNENVFGFFGGGFYPSSPTRTSYQTYLNLLNPTENPIEKPIH